MGTSDCNQFVVVHDAWLKEIFLEASRFLQRFFTRHHFESLQAMSKCDNHRFKQRISLFTASALFVGSVDGFGRALVGQPHRFDYGEMASGAGCELTQHCFHRRVERERWALNPRSCQVRQ